MLPLQDEAVTIEPQYDGVIMLSSEAVLFSDAKPRPDGSKVYHVFERAFGEPAQDEAMPTEDFQTRQEQLFSQAHENTLQGIQQVLAESGFVNQAWCEGSGAGEPAGPTSEQGFAAENPAFNLFPQMNLTVDTPQSCVDRHYQPPPSRVHHFEIVLPLEHKRRLLKRLLKRKGVDFVEFEPENRRIIIKTRRSVHTILSVLHGVDPSARLLGTSRDPEEGREGDHFEDSGR
ncbi:hypothetical protein GWK47_051179 [Chionoecetes opilio]|uniref:Uncharacterized protein n=1 Tax=Chionoecetes opilio TaxID=41210 RepID=A0A8J4Y7P8_CHIOP|nr:hypothetical protein GWK47_051179 [Chionoecetes opilio]